MSIEQLIVAEQYIALVRDLASIVFSIVAALIAYLSYRAAKKSILQPLRSVVISKQTEIITDLYKMLTETEVSAFYYDIIVLNTIRLLREYGYVFKNFDEVYKELFEKTSGKIILPGTEQLDFTVITPFDNEEVDSKEKNVEISKKKFDDLMQNQRVVIKTLDISSEYSSYMKKIGSLQTDLFLPNKINEQLFSYIKDINYNIQIAIPKTISDFIIQYSFRYKNGDKNFNVTGVYNMFNRSRKSHEGSIKALKREIRVYLDVDNNL